MPKVKLILNFNLIQWWNFIFVLNSMASRNTDPRTSESRNKRLNTVIGQANICLFRNKPNDKLPHLAVSVRQNPQKTKLDWNGQIRIRLRFLGSPHIWHKIMYCTFFVEDRPVLLKPKKIVINQLKNWGGGAKTPQPHSMHGHCFTRSDLFLTRFSSLGSENPALTTVLIVQHLYFL